MSQTDPVADMLSMVRNALMRRHRKVALPHSKFKEAVARVLADEGYFADVKVVEDEPTKRSKLRRKVLHLFLKYDAEGRPVVSGLERVSTPGRRVFASVARIPKVLDGLGVSVLSTSKGLMSSRRAKKEKVGGELICKVW